jgi:hypothetical protein
MWNEPFELRLQGPLQLRQQFPASRRSSWSNLGKHLRLPAKRSSAESIWLRAAIQNFVEERETASPQWAEADKVRKLISASSPLTRHGASGFPFRNPKCRDAPPMCRKSACGYRTCIALGSAILR